MAKFVSILGMISGALGLFFGFSYLPDDPQRAFTIVTISTVGIVGLLAFVRHVIFHKSDAKRLGWETDRPDWMFEVGFANLAFSIMAFVAVFTKWGIHAQAIVVIGYASYLLQAALLHGYRYFTDKEKSVGRLWRGFLATLLYSGMMFFFVISVLWQ